MNTCKHCGAETGMFALYCSDKCRQKAYRKRIAVIVKAAREQSIKQNDIAPVVEKPIEQPKISKPDEIKSYWQQRFEQKNK